MNDNNAWRELEFKINDGRKGSDLIRVDGKETAICNTEVALHLMGNKTIISFRTTVVFCAGENAIMYQGQSDYFANSAITDVYAESNLSEFSKCCTENLNAVCDLINKAIAEPNPFGTLRPSQPVTTDVTSLLINKPTFLKDFPCLKDYQDSELTTE